MKSMTGFGRGEASSDGVTWSVEAASVNRKQLEVAVSLPRDLAELEATVRNEVAAIASRGRVSITIRATAAARSNSALRVDTALAREYLAAARQLATELGLSDDLQLRDALRWPGVMEAESTAADAAAAWPQIKPAVQAALSHLVIMRTAEGAALRADIEGRLATVDSLLSQIKDRAGTVLEHHRKALHQRLGEAGLVLNLDDERLIKELVIYSDRCDISEELARAHSHLAQFATYIASAEPVGRSMDFLTQELSREINTMGSKANNAELAHLVVHTKTEIEKVREQIQNVE